MKLLTTKVQEKKALIGAEKVLQALRMKKVRAVFLAKNCPAEIKADVRHYATISNVQVIKVEQNNEELGVLCKKNFFVSVAGIIEE